MPMLDPCKNVHIEIQQLVYLGNTILVKLELWEFVIVFNNNFYSATSLCLRYASAKCGM